jgi:sister-chromatid-cohesion protein PDS5
VEPEVEEHAGPQHVEEPADMEIDEEEETEAGAGADVDEEGEVEVEDAEEEEEEDGTGVLQNDEPVTWKAGRQIPVSVLLPRLQALAEELTSLDQQEVARESLESKAKELSSTQLLDHKQYGIQIHALQCIVEMFRLLAPDAPYKASQLKTIFNFIISTVIPAVRTPSHAYNAQHLAIVASLAGVKSILLITELPGSEELIERLFTACFDVMADNNQGADKELLSKNVEFNFTALLSAIVDESQSLPPNVVEIILAQFLRADPGATTTKKGDVVQSEILKEVSPAYNMARSVCNACEDKMTRHIGQYFNSVLIDASRTTDATKAPKSRSKKRVHEDSDDDMSDSGVLAAPSEEDLREASKAHRLLRELWKTCPNVIRNVVPQVEAELGAENVPLRVMGVESVGDMIAGIGAAGPPPPVTPDPTAFPSQSLDSYQMPVPQNILLVPAAPQAFSSAYPSAYQSFIDRHRDKSGLVRGAWATAVGRIILTSAGGKGLDSDQETKLLQSFSGLLADLDEKVRLAAVQAISHFDFQSVLQKLGHHGGIAKEGSVLSNLAMRIKDPKSNVSTAAIELLGRIWGVASGAIIQGDERVREVVGPIPARIFDAVYVNQKWLTAVIHRTVFESLLPVGYPSIKVKSANSGDSQRIPDSQTAQDTTLDPDRVRVERILALVRDLDERQRNAFFSFQQNAAKRAKYILMILDLSEKIGAGTKSTTVKDDEQTRQKLIQALSSYFPDESGVEKHLLTFFGHYDRRNYVLSRFCVDTVSDYRKVNNAIKELHKRSEKDASPIASCIESVTSMLRASAPLVYNRSHVPAIVAISRTDDSGLGDAAHVLLKEISSKAPLVFEVHVKELCQALVQQAPSATKPNDLSASDTLKACAEFARQFPQKVDQSRNFRNAMVLFAKYGSPPTVAKHAVTVIVASADKKEMYVKDILQHCVQGFDVASDGSLSKLAAISQLKLLAYKQTQDYADAIQDVLNEALRNRSSADPTDPQWSDEIDSELSAKLWALKAIVNGLRGRVLDEETGGAVEDLVDSAKKTFRLLNTLIDQEGEVTGDSTPLHHRSRLRLSAAKLILKLCCNKVLDRTFLPRDFNRLTRIAQDPQPEVRAAFNKALRKYIGQGKLGHRFYGLLFLYAFEPVKTLKESTATFLKARAASFAKTGNATMVAVFAYLISLLAHHNDFLSLGTDDLSDFVAYILFYLKNVATEQNLTAIYTIAQRIKTLEDGIDEDKNTRLWTLADLSESMIRAYDTIHGWSLQLGPGKPTMPRGLYRPIHDGELAEKVASTRYLPIEMDEGMEELVRARLRPKKRKAVDMDTRRVSKPARQSEGDGADMPVRKRAKKTPKAHKERKTPKRRMSDAVPSSAQRKSTRVSNAKSYIEEESSDEEEFERWQVEEEKEEEEEEEEGSGSDADEPNDSSSTPPTSDPTPAPAKTSQSKPKTPAKPVAKPAESTPKPRKAPKAKAAPASKKAATREMPARAGRSTRNAPKDTMDIPSDSEELSDVPSELDA